MKKLKYLIIAAFAAPSFSALADSPAMTAAVHAEPIAPIEVPAEVAHRDCLRSTGTHLQAHSENGCLADNGTAYSSADLIAVGSSTLGGALRNMDPAITISSHR